MKLTCILIDDGHVNMPTLNETSSLDADMLLAARAAVGELRAGADIAEVVPMPGVQITRIASGWISNDQASKGTLFLSAEGSTNVALVAIDKGEKIPLETLKALVRGTQRPQTANDAFFGIGMNRIPRLAPAVVVISRQTSQVHQFRLMQMLHLGFCLADAVLSGGAQPECQMAKAA